MTDILKQLDAAAELRRRALDASRMAEAQMMDPNGRAASLASQYQFAVDAIDHAAIAAELAEARKVVEDAVPFIACHGAVERVKEHGNIESAENSEAILYRMLMMLGNHGAIERLGLKPAAHISAGKASGGGGE